MATNMAGRGVDVLLGGNPEGLAERDVLAKGYDPQTEEGRDFYNERLATHTEPTERQGQNVTRAAASTISSGAVPVVRVIRDRAASICRSKTT